MNMLTFVGYDAHRLNIALQMLAWLAVHKPFGFLSLLQSHRARRHSCRYMRQLQGVSNADITIIAALSSSLFVQIVSLLALLAPHTRSTPTPS